MRHRRVNTRTQGNNMTIKRELKATEKYKINHHRRPAATHNMIWERKEDERLPDSDKNLEIWRVFYWPPPR